MAWSGGNFTRVYGATGWATDAAGGVGIESGRHDVQDNDLATGIDSCLNKSGQNSMAADLNLGGYRPTNVAAGTAAAPAICAGNDVNTGMYSPGADQIGFATNGVERATITSDGRTAIGVGGDASIEGVLAASNTTLTLKGTNTYAQQVMITREASTTGSMIHLCKSRGTTAGSFTVPNLNDLYGEVSFRGGTGSAFVAAARITAQADNTPSATSMPALLRFWTTPAGSTTPASRMEIRNDGNIGIANSGSASARLTIIGEDTGTSNYSFATYGSSGVAANGLVVRNDGRVGVGTSSLNAKTVIAGESTTLPVLRLLGGGAGDVANRAFEIFKTDNDSTTSQNFVYFYINNGSTASGKINANGANAAAFGSTSDIRLKENVVNLPSQLDAILSLRPVEFDYKDGSGHQIGFIAQEVQNVFPDLIGEADGYLTLTDLNKNDARMIKAFQELAAKVTALEAKVAELEAVTEV